VITIAELMVVVFFTLWLANLAWMMLRAYHSNDTT